MLMTAKESYVSILNMAEYGPILSVDGSSYMLKDLMELLEFRGLCVTGCVGNPLFESPL